MKKQLYSLLEPVPPYGSWWDRSVDFFILGMILLSVGSVILSTMEGVAAEYGSYLRGGQIFATGVFTVEYILRLYVCTESEKYSHPVWGRLRFAASPSALVDLLAVAPFYLVAIFAPGANLAGAMLLLRMLRLLKLFRYSRSLIVFAQVLRDKADQLVAASLATGALLVFSSSLVYFAERGAQPDAFPSIPATMWWGIVTLTTVGYGDISPITPLGQFFGAITAIIGIGIVALPSGILASGFIGAFEEDQEEGEMCPNCGQEMRQE